MLDIAESYWKRVWSYNSMSVNKPFTQLTP